MKFEDEPQEQPVQYSADMHQQMPGNQFAGAQGAYQDPNAANAYYSRQSQQGYYAQTQENDYVSPRKRAWADIRESSGWFGQALVKALIQNIPVLNFVNNGQAIAWGIDIVQRRRTEFPGQPISGQNFKFGAIWFLLTVLFAIATGIASIIPFVGAIIDLLAMIFLTPVLAVMVMRAVLYDSISDAFAFSEIKDIVTRDYKGLWCAFFVPVLLLLIPVSALVIIGIVTMSFVAIGTIGSGNFMLLQIGGPLLCVILIALPSLLFSVLSIFWSMRAVGYWAYETVPEWGPEQIAAARFAKNTPNVQSGIYYRQPGQSYGAQNPYGTPEAQPPYGQQPNQPYQQGVPGTQPYGNSQQPQPYRQPAPQDSRFAGYQPTMQNGVPANMPYRNPNDPFAS